MLKKEILFSGERTIDKVLIYGFYHEISFDGVLYPYIFWQGESHPVIPKSVAQYHHTTPRGERIFKPIYYEADSITGKLMCLKEGEGIEIKSASFGSTRVIVSRVNKTFLKNGLKLSTKGDRINEILTVKCQDKTVY